MPSSFPFPAAAAPASNTTQGAATANVPSANRTVLIGPAGKALAQSARAGSAAQPSASSVADSTLIRDADSAGTEAPAQQHVVESEVWHEHVRLAQEALTLLRHILTDNLLGTVHRPLLTCIMQQPHNV